MYGTKRRVEDRIREELLDCIGDRTLHAVLDAARLPGVWAFLRELEIHHECLAPTVEGEDLTAVAPYLAALPLREDVLLWFRMQPEVLSATLFVVAEADFAHLRRHLKRYLQVETTDRRTVYFRFYDPRILVPFLSACNEDETVAFMGPMRAVFVRDPADDVVSDRPALLRWESDSRDAGSHRGEASSPRLPSALRKFRFRLEHEEALAQDAMTRYQLQVTEYLRGNCPAESKALDDEDLAGLIQRAMRVGSEIGMEAGQDVTLLAEAILRGEENTVRTALDPLVPALRRAELVSLCEGFRS